MLRQLPSHAHRISLPPARGGDCCPPLIFIRSMCISISPTCSTRSVRETMPTVFPASSRTGRRLIPYRRISATSSASGVAGEAVRTSRVMIAATASLSLSGRRQVPRSRTPKRCMGVSTPSPHRRRISLSETIPASPPRPSSTGAPEMPWRSRKATTWETGSLSRTHSVGECMTSAAVTENSSRWRARRPAWLYRA